MRAGRSVGCWSWWQELGTGVTVNGELIDYLIFKFTGDGYDSLKENYFNCFVQNSILLAQPGRASTILPVCLCSVLPVQTLTSFHFPLIFCVLLQSQFLEIRSILSISVSALFYKFRPKIIFKILNHSI